MHILLDTHIVLWMFSDASRLSADTNQHLTDSRNNLYVSAASVWEIAIKVSIGKLALPMPLQQLEQEILNAGIGILDLKTAHLIKVAELDFHHNDPFDRVIIAQSLIEKMAVISADGIFARYPITRIW